LSVVLSWRPAWSGPINLIGIKGSQDAGSSRVITGIGMARRAMIGIKVGGVTGIKSAMAGNIALTTVISIGNSRRRQITGNGSDSSNER
jgi:hypothetical protein